MRLSHALGSIKLTQARVTAENSDYHQRLQKPTLVNGLVRTYKPINDDGLRRHPETQNVQLIAEDALERIAVNYADLIDIEAVRAFGNTKAKADVTVNGKVLLKDAPPQLLIFIETQLEHMKVIIEKTVMLDQAQQWTYDKETGMHRSLPAETFTTEKSQVPLVLVAPTDKHPGQAQVITKDTIIGTWTTVHHSGALPYTRRQQLLSRVEVLLKAVSEALSECNATQVEAKPIGSPLFDFLLAE